VSDKYEFIDAGYATVATDTAAAPTVMRMCEWLQISKSGFYEGYSQNRVSSLESTQRIGAPK